MKLNRLMGVVSLILAAVVMSITAAVANTNKNTTSLKHTLVLDNLELPWDMAFLPDGTMFFTEKCKGLSVMMPNGRVNPLLGIGGAKGYPSTEKDLFCHAQAGMLGVAIDPDFNSNRRIYVYSASKKTDPHNSRLMRLVVDRDFKGVSDRTDIVTDVYYKMAPSDHPFGDAAAHNGGRVRFGPYDGYLYLTLGDGHKGECPQSPTLICSNVLRMDTDGNPAPENDPPVGFDKRMYTYGHRNVQGITWNPRTQDALITEHGPWHSDEITVLQNGGNGGWDPRPHHAGRGDCPDGYCGYSPNRMVGMNRYQRAAYMPMTDFHSFPDAMPPLWNNEGWSQGTMGADFLQGRAWGEWDGAMAVGQTGIAFGDTPAASRIQVLTLTDDGRDVAWIETMNLPMENCRFRSLVLGPDRSLYAACDEGMIHKLTP